MYKKIVLEMSENDICTLLGYKGADFNFESGASTPTGIRAILKGFYDKEHNLISKKEVAQKVMKQLREDWIITGEKKWTYEWEESHSWGPLNDDDCRPSVYSCRLIMSTGRIISPPPPIDEREKVKESL